MREACARSGISVEMSGFKSGTVLDRPEEALGSFDLVFAKARAALEAAATGAAVVLCDVAGTGPMVTTENFAALRRMNFGMRTLRNAATVDALSAEIARYDAADAMDVARQVRALAGQDVLVDQLLGIYGDVLAEPKETDLDAGHRAAAAYLRTLSPKLYERELLQMAFKQLLRVPLAGRMIRRRAGREHPAHWFQELLRATDAE